MVARHTLFQPTRPLRGATASFASSQHVFSFQPTRPLRGATWIDVVAWRGTAISTHAPLTGRDVPKGCCLTVAMDFYPRAPYGARLPPRAVRFHKPFISTHAPLTGRDQHIQTHNGLAHISTHAPLTGRDSKSVQITMHIFAITDKFQMLLHRMPPVRAFCSFLMQENHADFGCEPPR